MRSRLFTLALGGALALGVTALAQDTMAPAQEQGQGGAGRHGRRMDPDRQLQHLTKNLNLSTDQQNQIKPILDERQQKMQTLFQDQTISQQDRRTQARSIISDSDSKIEAVLNDEQKGKYAAMQEHRRHGKHGNAPSSEDITTPGMTTPATPDTTAAPPR